MTIRPKRIKLETRPYLDDKQRGRGSATRRGYDSQHRQWRIAVLRKHPFCVFCERENIITPATIADHIIPIEMNPALRLDVNNGRGVCQSCHNKITSNYRTTGINEMPATKIH